jgi:hypothetical protein
MQLIFKGKFLSYQEEKSSFPVLMQSTRNLIVKRLGDKHGFWKTINKFKSAINLLLLLLLV